jgi:hypothetical protein
VALEPEEVAGLAGPKANKAFGPIRSVAIALSSAPIFQGIRPLAQIVWSREIVAGLELAATALPQALGYTKIAGMPVVTGLYALFVAPLALQFSALHAYSSLLPIPPPPPLSRQA